MMLKKIWRKLIHWIRGLKMYFDADIYRSLMKIGCHHAVEKYFGMAVVERKRKMRGGWKRK